VLTIVIPAQEFVKKSILGPAQSQIQAQRRPLEWVSTDKFTNSQAGIQGTFRHKNGPDGEG
jgi:hypothetical protein